MVNREPEISAADAGAPGSALDRTLGRLRLVAVYALVGALVGLARPRPADAAVGLFLVTVGEALRVWAAGHLRKNVELVTSGPYAYTRNPLYLGRLMIFTGLAITARLPLAAHLIVVLPLGWVVFFAYYLPRKERVEPARLAGIHGERFERYRGEVPALLPARRRWPGASRERWSARRMARNREPWMIVSLLAIAAYLTWRAWLGTSG